jgi:hypothetical protein
VSVHEWVVLVHEWVVGAHEWVVGDHAFWFSAAAAASTP